MISAGELYGPQQNPGYPPPGNGGWYGGQPQPAGPTLNAPMPISYQGSGRTGTQMSVNGTLTSDQTYKMMNRQSWWDGGAMVADSVGQTIASGLNYALQAKALNKQASIAGKYYETQGEIAGYQRDVALAQLSVQEEAINAQESMHRDQCTHEEKMLRLEGSVQARLAMIQESGKNRRAEIMSMTDAFSRTGWNMGQPAIAA